jgi:hypothetical protein
MSPLSKKGNFDRHKIRSQFLIRKLTFSHINQQGNNMSKPISRFSFSAVISQLSNTWKTIVIGILISLGSAAFTVMIAKLTGNSISSLAKDPAEIRHFPPYIGMLSNWGVILWVVTATICLFSVVLLKLQKATDGRFKFLLVSGLFSLLLGLDDLYLLHDRLLPRIFHMPEIFFYLLYFFCLCGLSGLFHTSDSKI